MKEIQKRFPADTSLGNGTRFLNNSKLDGELYAYLQSYSMPYQTESGNMQTRVCLKDLPKQYQICKDLEFGSPKTLKSHLKLLMDAGYVIEDGQYYILDNLEEVYLMIPLKTLRFLLDVVKEQIIKIYIYLGQRYRYALSEGRQYEFTLQEIADHIGLKTNGNGRTYEVINNALSALADFGLICYVKYYNGNAFRHKLTGFTFEYKDNAEKNKQGQVV